MKTLIIGGGLSGLAVADALETQGLDYILLEARSRFGGRIKTEQFGAGYFDMGPAWFWPGQPRIAAMIARLGLEKFDQFADGILTFEDEQGQVQRGRGFASMEGSLRLKGGLGALTSAMAANIPDARKRLNAPVKSLTKAGEMITATLGNGDVITVDRVVLAVPPRVASEIEFTPALPENTTQTMQEIPTWMAGQAKAVAVYETPFWRDQGLSGDAMSRHGPMVEIHDASPETGGPFALFGFIGVAPQNRRDEHALRDHVLAQLGRLFGDQATDPSTLFIKDWALDPYTSTAADHAPLYANPTYGLPQSMQGLWDNAIHFAGTEVAPQFGGYVEGALEAAENVLKTLQS
ncbi:FAD-dependent oxidoreductase [Pseudosulfitobacter sp. SM2401]|uniref:flavin monoamine oxidase family protein n=1 Tax=Pseudosulfitobacter sp. SM2401 TaxID=3350098 RepID=UPI0036F30964